MANAAVAGHADVESVQLDAMSIATCAADVTSSSGVPGIDSAATSSHKQLSSEVDAEQSAGAGGSGHAAVESPAENSNPIRASTTEDTMFYHVSCVSPASSPDPRAQREAAVAAIANHIREKPTAPADPAQLEQPWAEA